ncbi:MAG TPA: beta-galactosidase, partial [Roseimicrobium sp.]|nr:beta-galactosidase [Roseimicrobium sp.]
QTADHAIAEAREILAHPEQELKFPDYNMSNLKIRNGYFYDGEVPALLTGLYTNTDVAADYEALAEAGICFTQPERLNMHCTLPEEGKVNTAHIDTFVVHDTLENAQGANIGCVIDLGLQYMPGWAKEKYPTIINPGSSYNPYGPYSIVSEDMKNLTRQYIDQLIPKASKFGVNLGYEMANQAYNNPWSPQVILQFQEWAKQKYETIDVSNAAWGANFKSFEEIQPLEDMREIQPLGLRNDWIRFQHRLTAEWYNWLKTEIKARDPKALVEVQLAGNYFQPQKFKLHDCARVGIDEVDLYRNITDITGIDFCTWYWGRFVYEQAGQHCDLLRSIAPDKPIINFEYGFGTYNSNSSWSADYMRASLWYSYLHGMAGNTAWIWTVTELADESQLNTLARWPDRTETLGRTALELRRHADAIARFGRQKGEIAILYSAPSRWFDDQKNNEYYEQARRMWHAVSMVDAPFEFICDEQVGQGELKRFKVLLVPACTYVSDATYNKVREFVRNGGSIVMTAGSFGKDEYAKPRALSEPWKAVTHLPALLDRAEPSREGKGSIYGVNDSGVGDYQRLINKVADRTGVQRPIRVTVGNDLNRSIELRCVRKGKGEYLLYCFNLDATPAEARFELKDGFRIAGKDLLRGRAAEGRMTLQPMELCLWRVSGPN